MERVFQNIIKFVSFSAYNKYTPGDLDVVLGKMQDQEVDKEVERLFTDENWVQKMVPKMREIWPGFGPNDNRA